MIIPEWLEKTVCLIGLALFVGLPCWYWLFSERTRFYEYPEAKKIMSEKVVYDHRVTIYCGAAFDEEKNIYPGYGFSFKNRAHAREMMDWEHAVPVAEFGKNFAEWRAGSPECVHNGRPFRGRKCAERVNGLFRRMQGDMYNLFPAIASVNSARGDKRYAELPEAEPAFGSCQARIGRSRFEPPDQAKGQVARAALYMDAAYDKLELQPGQKKLFEAWNEKFPVDKWECIRTKRIEKIQGNENIFVKKPCIAAGLW